MTQRRFPLRCVFSLWLCVVLGVACTPGTRPTPHDSRTIVEGSCMLLRVLSSDGTVDDVCATLEELGPVLVPLVERLIAERAERPAAPARVEMALAIPAPAEHVKAARRRARRPRSPPRCVELADAGDAVQPDATTRDAAQPDATTRDATRPEDFP